MANWRQIQARIRKARNAADAPAQLAALYEQTRDAMVAYDLACVHEKAENRAEAVGWFTLAYERFRRTEWRKKCADGLVRLGAPVPEDTGEPQETLPVSADHAGTASTVGMERATPPQESPESEEGSEGQPTAAAEADRSPGTGKRRRRGRRGGRGRKRSAGTREPTAVTGTPLSIHERGSSAEDRRGEPRVPLPLAAEAEVASSGAPAPSLVMPTAAGRARAGDPGFSSRLAQLDSQLRRLFSAPQCRLDETDQAPAGPGVFLLSESDQSAFYYVEACRTLRIALGLLAKSERARGGEGSLRGRMAEHLGISESKVSKYLKDHCSVRWLQLDDGAPHLAHFAVAVLKPTLNDS